MARVAADRICLILLLAWLFWLPLPFGSNIDQVRPILVLVPLVLCTLAGALASTRRSWSQPEQSWRLWTLGGLLFLIVAIVQLVPLDHALLQTLSPASAKLWGAAWRIRDLAGSPAPPSRWPVTIDPDSTLREFFRCAALLATFQAAALLVTTRGRRTAMAGTLAAICAFEAIYGLRQAALQNYDVWGWHNGLIYNRITGTFVNPNHYAHFLLITVPFAVLTASTAWRESLPGAPVGRRIAHLVERRGVLFSLGVLTAVAALGAVLLAQSRGSLLAGLVGAAGVIALITRGASRKRVVVARMGIGVVAAGLLLFAFASYLGRNRTIARFEPLPEERTSFVGRRVGISSAAALWRRFPALGSGIGTFGEAVSMTQDQDPGRLYHHAHNDYAEIAATAGAAGFAIAVAAIMGGALMLVRNVYGYGPGASSNRRAFQVTALVSLSIALIHSLYDFNFFIPANAATLAAICGTAVSFRQTARAGFDPEASSPGRHRRREASLETS